MYNEYIVVIQGNFMKKTGIKDVAKAAGVSITTVSRALNGYDDVNEDTREKIKKIAKEMNYAPNINAKFLSGKSDVVIGLLVSGLREKDESGLVFGILSGAYHSAIKNNCEFILMTTNQSQQSNINFIQLCRQKNINGVIVQGLRTDDKYYKELKNTEISCVAIDLDIECDNVVSMSINNEMAAYDAVNYLINNGHKNIAIINGTNTAVVSKERFNGYKKALEENGISIDNDYIKNGMFTEEIAYEKMIELIDTHPEITAVFCSSDVMAIGAINAIKEKGKSVPEDISIMGFDDMSMAKYINGGISTIKQDPFDIGQAAGDLVFDMINNDNYEKHIDIAYELIERNTVRNIK